MAIFRHLRKKLLVSQAGMAFDPVTRLWQAPCPVDDDCEPLEPEDALRWLQQDSGTPIKIPVAVIGTRTPDPAQAGLAETIGRLLAEHGLTVLCGGKGGVMEAVCRGVASIPGGLSIGLLPDDDPEAANSFVTVPIATGIGVARNAIIARAAFCLVAVGGGHGTVSEIAFGLQFGKPIVRLGQAPDVPGAFECGDTQQMLRTVANAALRL